MLLGPSGGRWPLWHPFGWYKAVLITLYLAVLLVLWLLGFLGGIGGGIPVVEFALPEMAHPDSWFFLQAISVAAVFFGAMTYIGNAPNFMVKAIAESAGVKMPSFFGYMAYSGAILLPPVRIGEVFQRSGTDCR